MLLYWPHIFPRCGGKNSHLWNFSQVHVQNPAQSIGNKGSQNLTAQFLPCSVTNDKVGASFSTSPFTFPSLVLPRNARVVSSKANIRPASLCSGWRVQDRKDEASPAGEYSWIRGQQRELTESRNSRWVSCKEGKRKKGNHRGRNGRHPSWYQPGLQHPMAQRWLLLPQRALPSAPASHSGLMFKSFFRDRSRQHRDGFCFCAADPLHHLDFRQILTV